jgi:hypothetical protein
MRGHGAAWCGRAGTYATRQPGHWSVRCRHRLWLPGIIALGTNVSRRRAERPWPLRCGCCDR